MTRPAAWAALAASASGYEPEDDTDLLAWMAAEAAGMAGYTQALITVYEACITAGLTPAAVGTLHDVAAATAHAAQTMAAARRTFAAHYAAIREYAAGGGIMPYNGRWVTGTETPAIASRTPAAGERANADELTLAVAAPPCRLCLYHVSPARNRESIRENGLDKTRGNRGPRVYLSDEEGARIRANLGQRDVWKVDVTGIPLREDKTDARGSWYAQRSIPPERITLHRPCPSLVTGSETLAIASRPPAAGERADVGELPGADVGDTPQASDPMTALLIGPPDMTWQPCEEHGIPYSRCWACNKAAGRCSYGLCGDPPTHVVTGSGRRCCGPHARYLASINGGDVRELAPDPGDERAPEQGADEVVISLADGDARTAPVLRDDAGGGSYACPWCQSPVFSPEAWEEHERQNAAACERLGEVHQPQPYLSIDAAAWQARGCANPMCWVNLPAGQLTDARRRREETEARDRERDHAERARQRYKDEYGQRRRADNQTWERLQADSGITAPPAGGRARRGDLIVICQEHPSFGAGDPYDSYTVGVVTSVTRDGGVKAYRPAGDFPEPERAGRPAGKGTDLARQRPDRFWVLPADGIDVPAALATAACHTWPDSQLPQPYESLEEVRAVIQPHLATAPAARREALRVAAARWDDARRQARAGDGYEARLAAARDADEAYRRAAENSALRTEGATA